MMVLIRIQDMGNTMSFELPDKVRETIHGSHELKQKYSMKKDQVKGIADAVARTLETELKKMMSHNMIKVSFINYN